MDLKFAFRVFSYIDGSQNTRTPFSAIEAREFAPGVLCVLDTTGEFSIYFDMEHWEVAHPTVWGDAVVPPRLHGLGIGVLEALHLRGFDTFLAVAKSSLKPKRDWHAAAESVPIPGIIDGSISPDRAFETH